MTKAEGCEGIQGKNTRLGILRGGMKREYFTKFPASSNDSLILSSREFENTGIIK